MARNQRLSATITIGAALDRSVGRSLNVVRRGLDNVNAEIGELTSRRRDMERQRRELERQGQSVEDLDREYADLGRTLDDLRARQERLARVSRASVRVGETFSAATDTIGRVARRAAVGVGLLGGAIVGVTNRQAEGIEGLSRWANRLGTSTEFLSEIDNVAGRFGLGLDEVGDGLRELSMRADEFATTGGGAAAEAFDRLGFSQAEVADMAGDTASMFATVRERMSEITDNAARLRIADEIFGGTAGEGMIELLQLSQAEFNEMIEDARAAGATVSEEQARVAREMRHAFRRVGAVIEGVTRRVSVELMPAITTAMETLSNYLIENRDRIVEIGVAIADRISAAVPVALELAGSIGSVIGRITEGATELATFVGGWENLGVAVGALFAGKAILSIGRLGFALIGLIAATGPVGLVIAGIAAAAGLIIANWDWIRDKAIEAWDALRDGAQSAVDWVVDKFQWLSDQITALLAPVRDAFSFAGGVVDRVGNFFEPDAPSRGSVNRVQTRAVGGTFLPGATLVGERGPELRFENRAGFIATNRQLRGMTDMAERIRGVALGGMGGNADAASLRPIQMTVHATINAAALDPRQIAQELEDLAQRRARSALYEHSSFA